MDETNERICALCRQPATGFASTWTAATGELWFCHGDDDAEPTCYERAGSLRSEAVLRA